MPFELALPKSIKKSGWKVKIREKERCEPPHVTIFCRARIWRLSLRDSFFLIPPGGKWQEIHPIVIAALKKNWLLLHAAWDAMYPSNPISSI